MSCSSSAVKLVLDVRYPDDYPDVIPELSLEPEEGDFSASELENLLNGLRSVVCETTTS